MMPASPSFWHQRYLTQATWTATLRLQAYDQAEMAKARRVLEVGSGTGVILGELAQRTPAQRVGIDIDPPVILFAHRQDPGAHLAVADGSRQPFPASAFDIVVCHFLLLWTADPGAVVREMRRVVRPGGWVLCLAEPDYGGRIDHPPPLVELGQRQTQGLRAQGADPTIGRTVKALLVETGLKPVRSGVLGAEWTTPPAREAIESEWEMLLHDLRDTVPPAELRAWRRQDLEDWNADCRILYVPTFFALAVKPG
jgi:SAM-dependent methyltransferase